MPSFGAVLIGCQFGNIPPAPRVPAKRRTAYVVPAWARLSTPICDVLAKQNAAVRVTDAVCHVSGLWTLCNY